MASLDNQLSRPITVGICNTCSYLHISPIDGADSDIHIQPKTHPSFTLIRSSPNKPTLSEEDFLRAVKVSEAYQKVLGSLDNPSQLQVTCTVRYDLRKKEVAMVEIAQGCNHECTPPQARPDHPEFAQYMLQKVMQAQAQYALMKANASSRGQEPSVATPSRSHSDQPPASPLHVTVSQMPSPSYVLNPNGSVIISSGSSITIVQRSKEENL